MSICEGEVIHIINSVTLYDGSDHVEWVLMEQLDHTK